MVPEKDEFLLAIWNKEPANHRLFWVRETGLSPTALWCLYVEIYIRALDNYFTGLEAIHNWVLCISAHS
jgi:hypothetical protein